MIQSAHRPAHSTPFRTVCAVPSWLQVDGFCAEGKRAAVSSYCQYQRSVVKGQPYPFHSIPSFEPNHGGVVLLLDGAEDAATRPG